MTKRSYKIGHSREQVSLLPPCIEDYVAVDNPVRAIDGYVDSLDLGAYALAAAHPEAVRRSLSWTW
jgi:hypothetical protein